MPEIIVSEDGAPAYLQLTSCLPPPPSSQGATKPSEPCSKSRSAFPTSSHAASRSTASRDDSLWWSAPNDSFSKRKQSVGKAHKQPSIPCYFVTTLDDAILRRGDIEMTALYREPTAGQILRTGGDPTDGACALSSGQTVFVF
jgi:hypothetical protein